MDSFGGTVTALHQRTGETTALPELHPGRPHLAAVLAITTIVACSVAFAFWPVASSWQPEALLLACMLVAVVSYVAGVQNRSRIFYCLTEAPALVALAILGPLPTALINATSDLTDFALVRYRKTVVLTNIACVLLSVLAASSVLLLCGVEFSPSSDLTDYAVLLGAGMILSGSFSLTLALMARITDGLAIKAMLDVERVSLGITTIPSLVAACVATWLYFKFGVVAVLALAPVLLVLQGHLMRILERRTPRTLAPDDLLPEYVGAISDVLSLSRRQRKILQLAAENSGARTAPSAPEHFQSVMNTILYSTEHWDGSAGFPGVTSRELIPLESRVLAVARHWAQLAAGGKGSEAILSDLRARAGTEFDPEIVAAAVAAFDLGAVAGEPRLWVQVGTKGSTQTN